MNILLCSGFFESELPSYREYAYTKELAKLGHKVTLLCGDQSHIWKRRTFGFTVTNPSAKDDEFMKATSVKVVRRHIFFRYSDFVLYLPSIQAIKDADVIHIIEFRTGTTVLIAMLAKLFGKPVVYDHEQRGDRFRHWTSRVDSVWRRQLIWFGAHFVDHVRHTVIQNLLHFKRCSNSKATTQLAPLGTDPHLFYFRSDARSAIRQKLGIAGHERVAIVSGKLHPAKLIDQVILACRQASVRLILVGVVSDDMKPKLDALPPGNEIYISYVDAQGLAQYYSAADMAIFTTFTLSYWEAYTTGLSLIVARTAFSELAFKDDPCVQLFGSEELFKVPDELYKPNTDIVLLVAQALSASIIRNPRDTQFKFAAQQQIKLLEQSYRKLLPAAAT
jgi:glycosyltransferase involved in cell wall biosynthesis